MSRSGPLQSDVSKTGLLEANSERRRHGRGTTDRSRQHDLQSSPHWRGGRIDDLTLALPPAYAGSYVSVEQYGAQNSFGIAQQGKRNRQNGYFNNSIGTQTGARNRVVIGQDGRGHNANAAQFGRGNIAGIAQFGHGHTAITTQDGNGNAVGVIQVGAATAPTSPRSAAAMCRSSSRIDRQIKARVNPMSRISMKALVMSLLPLGLALGAAAGGLPG